MHTYVYLGSHAGCNFSLSQNSSLNGFSGKKNSLRADFHIRAVLANFGLENQRQKKKHNEKIQNGTYVSCKAFW